MEYTDVFPSITYTEDPAPFLKHSVYTAALAFSVAVMAYRLLNDTVRLRYKIVMILFNPCFGSRNGSDEFYLIGSDRLFFLSISCSNGSYHKHQAKLFGANE